MERLGLPSLASLPSLAPLLGIDVEEAADDEPAATLDAADTVDLTGDLPDEPETAEIETGSTDDTPV